MTSLHMLTGSVADVVAESVDVASGIGEMSGGVSGIAKAIAEYGPIAVLLGLFFVLFLLMAVFIFRTNSKVMNKILKDKDTINNNGALSQDLINKIVESALENHNQKSNLEIESLKSAFSQSLHSIEESLEVLAKHETSQHKQLEEHNGRHEYHNDHHHYEEEDDYHRDLVGAYIDVNIAFKDASREALNRLNCDRVAIYVFHNGNTSMHGLPFFKMSCIHEWTAMGKNTLRGKYHSDMPLHMFNDFIQDLWKEKIYICPDIEIKAKEDPSIKEFTSYSSTTSLYMMAIVDKNNVLAGFIVAEFSSIEEFNMHIVNNSAYEILNEMKFKISPIIVNQYLTMRGNDHNKK